jgi:hypothetical protein
MRIPTETCALAGMLIRNKEDNKAVLMKFLIRLILLLKKILVLATEGWANTTLNSKRGLQESLSGPSDVVVSLSFDLHLCL